MVLVYHTLSWSTSTVIFQGNPGKIREGDTVTANDGVSKDAIEFNVDL